MLKFVMVPLMYFTVPELLFCQITWTLLLNIFTFGNLLEPSLFILKGSAESTSPKGILSFSAIVNCTASSCQATFNSWTTYDPKGSITFFVVFDSDKDGVFGEVGEPYACEDAIDYEAGVLDVISESSADLGYDDIQ